MGILVIDPGLSATVQDTGRPGYREWGVPLGGYVRPRVRGLANALLGNSPDCAVLELTLTGGIYQAEGSLAFGARRRPDGGEGSSRLDSTEHFLQLP